MVLLHSSRTDADGRCGQSLLVESEVLRAGLYRISFDTASYQNAHETKGSYPIVEITFQVRANRGVQDPIAPEPAWLYDVPRKLIRWVCWRKTGTASRGSAW